MPQRASNRRRRGRRRKEGPFALQLKRPLRLVVRRHRRRRGAELVEVRDLRWPRQAGSQAQGGRRRGAEIGAARKRGEAPPHSATARANRNLSSRTFTSSLPAITHDLSSMKRSRTSRTCAQKSKGGKKGRGGVRAAGGALRSRRGARLPAAGEAARLSHLPRGRERRAHSRGPPLPCAAPAATPSTSCRAPTAWRRGTCGARARGTALSKRVQGPGAAEIATGERTSAGTPSTAASPRP